MVGGGSGLDKGEEEPAGAEDGVEPTDVGAHCGHNIEEFRNNALMNRGLLLASVLELNDVSPHVELIPSMVVC